MALFDLRLQEVHKQLNDKELSVADLVDASYSADCRYGCNRSSVSYIK